MAAQQRLDWVDTATTLLPAQVRKHVEKRASDRTRSVDESYLRMSFVFFDDGKVIICRYYDMWRRERIE